MPDIVWQDPPAAPRRGRPVTSECAALLAELKANPGRWAVLRTPPTMASASTSANRLRSGEVKSLAGCEAVARKVDGVPTVFVRWPA